MGFNLSSIITRSAAFDFNSREWICPYSGHSTAIVPILGKPKIGCIIATVFRRGTKTECFIRVRMNEMNEIEIRITITTEGRDE